MSALAPAVCVLVAREDGRHLFIERARAKFAAGYWTPVTGRLEPGETHRAAAAREVAEEVGLAVVVGRELGKTGTETPGGGSAGFELTWFLASPAPGADPDALRLDPSEVASARWVTLDEALALRPTFETTRSFLRGLVGSL